MNRKRSTLLPLALVALAAAATACGTSVSSGGGASTSGAAATAPSTAIPTADVTSAVTADGSLKSELPAAVQASGVLTLGTPQATGQSQLPHGGEDASGQQIGLDVDLRNAVAKKLGVTLQVTYGTFATIIPGVQNGKFQVGMGNFGATKAREQVIDFASYLTDGQAFLGPKGGPLTKVTQITDLCGLTVATSPGSTFQQILTTNANACTQAGKPAFTVQYFADTAPIILGLQNGKVQAYFGPTLSLQYDATHVPGTQFLGQFSSTTVGFAVGKDSGLAQPLADAVNALIAEGSYAKILNKWGVEQSSGITHAVVNPPTTF